MTIEVRRIGAEELRDYFGALTTAFLERPDVDRIADDVRKLWDLDRCWAAFDDGRVCGTFRSWETEMTLPGGARLPAAAVSAVSVLPTHRRQGILRRMVAAEHAASRERGEAFALLYASEFPIYGRFGYGPATREGTWTLNARATRFHGMPAGTMEVAEPGSARAAIIEVFERWRADQPGELRRREYRWDIDLGLRTSAWGADWKGFLAVHRDAHGAVDAYARYHADEKWELRQPQYTIVVDEMHALNDEAYSAVWQYLASIDWVANVKAERRSPGERLPWFLTNSRAASVSEVGEGLWVRIFDFPRALSERTYEHEGSVVLEVIDGEAPDGRVRVRLDAGTDGATACLTDEAPDLTLHAAALGAAYLGGTPLRYATIATGADEHRAGALVKADALFRTASEPWCSTFF